ncbi:MAG TPA: alpha/beta hydrolase [Chitinophagaceae bacterium]|jgi:acetyl esterase/lipase|nr:alpha/beta hydrolase [Chitinophagaceae bacterium]
MNKILLVFLTTLIFISCKKTDDGLINDVLNPNAEITLTDIAYASTSTQQNMDVYLPAGRTPSTTYTVIMIHGGSWSGGDKSDFNTDIPNLKPLLGNYAIFNLNYRLANGTTILLQQQLNDIDAAINYIYSNATKYSINTNKIAIMGASAGAHLTLLKCYKANTDGKIKAVVDLFGPTNMAWMYNSHPVASLTQPIIVNVMGGTPTSSASVYTSGSPINFVTSTVPPTIIFHGTADPIVPISESINLQAKLQLAGVTNQYITYTGESHGWTGANLTDTYTKAVAFIKNYVK